MDPFDMQPRLLLRQLGPSAVFPGRKLTFPLHLCLSFCQLSGFTEALGLSL